MSGIGASVLCELTRVGDDMLARYIVEDWEFFAKQMMINCIYEATAEFVCLQQMFHVCNL